MEIYLKFGFWSLEFLLYQLITYWDEIRKTAFDFIAALFQAGGPGRHQQDAGRQTG